MVAVVVDASVPVVDSVVAFVVVTDVGAVVVVGAFVDTVEADVVVTDVGAVVVVGAAVVSVTDVSVTAVLAVVEAEMWKGNYSKCSASQL